jgi:uncharacterized membrane protein
MNGGQHPALLCVLLVCFAGAKRASQVKSELGEGIRSGGGTLLDEVVLKVNPKGKPMIHDPRRTRAGAVTSALTWGLFGLLASGGSWRSLVFWALIGAVCGGLYAYFTEHLLSRSQLKRIGERMGPDASGLAIWAEAADAERLLSKTAPLQPETASVAAVADDLSAKVFAGGATPGQSSSPGADEGPAAVTTAATSGLSMLLLRYPGEHAAQAALKEAPKAGGDAPQVELVFESARSGKRRVIGPAKGVAAMAKSDVLSWGLFGVAYGAIVGAVGNGGILSWIENGVVTGVLWAILGLGAGALYGLWAGRGVSARRLKGVGPLLPPDSSVILAWADGAVTERTIGTLSTPDAETLVLRFNTLARGAILEV